MKLTVIIMTTLLMRVSASGFAQKITFSQKQVTAKTVFKEIARQTGYQVVCDGDLLKAAIVKDVSFKKTELNDVLNLFFPGMSLSWSIEDNTLIITQPAEVLKKKAVAERQISGIVKDVNGGILPGVSVTVKEKPSIGTSTDLNGRYILSVPDNAVLVFSMVSFKKQEIATANKTVINVTLLESDDALEEVVVTAFGNVQRKSDLIGAVTSISPKDLKIPSSNLTAALQGRISGMVSFQRSGEPGMDNADFFIRGVGTFGVNQKPLILIDNMEVTTDQLARIPPDDIASFSILKDATASAVYGSRGANGVILVTTKVGIEGPAKINMRIEQRVSAATQKLRIADPVTFMKMNNEALLTRDPLAITPYTDEKVALTEAGVNPLLYPAVDWLSILTKDYTNTQNYSLSVAGGGSLATYSVSGSLTQDNGLLKVNPINNFNSNVDFKTYNLRSNINFNLTKSTQLMVRTIGNFQSYSGPPITGSEAFAQAISANPVLFQPMYVAGSKQAYIKHPLFGNYDDGSYSNPYANMVRGYQERNTNNMQIQLELKQDLSKLLTEGLAFRSMANLTRTSEYQIVRQYNPFYYVPEYNENSREYTYLNLNPDKGTETLNFSPSGSGLSALFYMENAFNYSRTFNNKHLVTGMVIGTLRNNITQPKNEAFTLLNTLPFRNLSFSGSFTYAYDNRYHFQFAFGYNGSERFDENFRWGYFPSAGIAWTIHNEKFMEPLKDIISTLRIRGTHGLVGNDVISKERFFYLSDINLSNSSRGFSFGTPGSLYTVPGISTNRYANPTVRWEKSKQTNIGLDLGLFKSAFNVTLDAYRQDRSDIVQERTSLPVALGLAQVPLANLGKYRSEGIDIEATYNHTVNNNLWFQGRGTFTFSRGKYIEFEEPNYNYAYLSRLGYASSQQRGLIAERLFTDDAEVLNSPLQDFGSKVRGGDIKYLDVNNDGVINADDMMPIGYPTTPQINYGFGLSTGYKSFDLSFFFSGIGNTSLFISPISSQPGDKEQGIAPFGSVKNPKAVLQEIADSHWTEENQDAYAFWPRLSPSALSNNTQKSTYWMRNGAFLRLKQVEFGYKLNSKFTKRFKIEGLRFYASATNLFIFSSFKSWDPEMGGNGLAYPLQKVYNMGLYLTL
ncbi:MAG: TonB-dependent receptor [Candidatus Pedobacter colombiensis]|uniref:TonB-dependent receptor n=1 Tax=Candidatus Pedobacter colombiensis TaxID=3121371 RepID=A0AAJ6B731_9SPHI|nr:TonB-dependent receptor [Pedobacter sp.]WEK17643.1 MAG: TonB-dependent receptor [Pedobacter sp.]